MTDKDEQLKHFREALERKQRAAQQASLEGDGHAGPPPGEQGHAEPGHSPREQGHGKEKMTADKWNQ
jgi:hypothetical protein